MSIGPTHLLLLLLLLLPRAECSALGTSITPSQLQVGPWRQGARLACACMCYMRCILSSSRAQGESSSSGSSTHKRMQHSNEMLGSSKEAEAATPAGSARNLTLQYGNTTTSSFLADLPNKRQRQGRRLHADSRIACFCHKFSAIGSLDDLCLRERLCFTQGKNGSLHQCIDLSFIT